jgi:dTDP-4-amino-4,6-dideoxygalactose transaminase
MIPIAKPILGAEEQRALAAVVESGALAMGPRVAAFEERFAGITGARHAIAVSSGTASLHLALLAHGVGPGDEVITTSFTFIATVHAILMVGARPVFADIDPVTFNLEPDAVAARVGPRTKAILAVHLFGHPARLDELAAIAESRGIPLLQDAAQAVGARYRGRSIGSEGTACFSLYATKNLMCGEGGMVVTDDAEVAERVRLLRNHGMPRRYFHDRLGFNLKMSELHAAIGLCQAERFEVNQARRRATADIYGRELRGSMIVPEAAPDVEHAWHQYTLRVPAGAAEGRDALAQRLGDAGIGTGIFYPLPAHQQPSVIGAVGETVGLTETERASREVLSIPIHPGVGDAEALRIAQEIRRPCLMLAM